MEYDEYVSAVERDSAALAAAVELDAEVAGCPGWTGRDLLLHIGEVQTFWAANLLAGGPRPEEVADTEPAEGQDPYEWYAEAWPKLAAALRQVGPDASSWVWWNKARVDSAYEVARRQAHEAAVHRWDADQQPIEAALAADGVTEFGERMLPFGSGTWTTTSGAVLLSATDTGDAWTVTAEPDGPVLGAAPAGEPAAVVSGTASDLDLWLWRRADDVAVRGDGALVAAVRRWADLD